MTSFRFCKSCRRAIRIAPPAVNHRSVAASIYNCFVSAEMSCGGSECQSIMNLTNLEVNTSSRSDCATVSVKCPLSGQRLANMISVYTCSNGVWTPLRPRSCIGQRVSRRLAYTYFVLYSLPSYYRPVTTLVVRVMQ